MVDIGVNLADQAKVMEQIWEQEEGWDDRFFDLLQAFSEALDLGDEDVHAPEWFFFTKDGASTRCKAYSLTRELVEKRLGRALSVSPREIPYVRLAKEGKIKVRCVGTRD